MNTLTDLRRAAVCEDSISDSGEDNFGTVCGALDGKYLLHDADAAHQHHPDKTSHSSVTLLSE